MSSVQQLLAGMAATAGGGGTFATFDPAAKSGHITLSGGNLIATSDADASYQNVAGTLLLSSGVRQCEWTLGASTISARRLGLSQSGDSVADGNALGASATGYAYDTTVNHKFNNGDQGAYGATATTGDVIGMVWNADTGDVHFYKNGADQGLAFSGVSGSFRIHHTGLGTGATVTLNTGQTAFAHAVGGATGWSV